MPPPTPVIILHIRITKSILSENPASYATSVPVTVNADNPAASKKII